MWQHLKECDKIMIDCEMLSYTLDELSVLLKELGQPAYRAKQLFSWIHAKNVFDVDKMSNMPQSMKNAVRIGLPQIVEKQISADRTTKYLLRMPDGNCVETVAMFYDYGMSVCVSSQAGCRMGCAFCASTKNGLARNLTPGEILAQIYLVTTDLNTRVHSIVLMGTGEPLDNFDNVVKFYEIITDKSGYALPNRSVSLSTCGLADKIMQLADLKLQLTLSVSLHAAFDSKRNELMPVNRAFPIEKLMEACRYYVKATGRRISFEYAVIDKTNNTKSDASELVKLLKGIPSHVNIIPINSGGGFKAEGREAARAFCEMLVGMGLTATVRRTLGTDIDAACGQLRNRYIE